MDNQKLQAALDKQNEIMEKTKPAALKIALGEWAVYSIKNHKPLNNNTLREWAESDKVTKTQKDIILELLAQVIE